MGLSSSEPNSQDYERDPVFQQRVAKLHRLTVYGRWLLVGGLWLTIGLLSLWLMRGDISLMLDYFTWSALKYSLVFNPIAALGLAICIGLTVGVLLWQSRNILFGLSEPEQKRLERQVCKIAQQGKSHPLWRFVYEGHDVCP